MNARLNRQIIKLQELSLGKRLGGKTIPFKHVKFSPSPESGYGWSKTQTDDGKSWITLYLRNDPVYHEYINNNPTGKSLECWSYPRHQTIDHITKHEKNTVVTFKNFLRVKSKEDADLRKVKDLIIRRN